MKVRTVGGGAALPKPQSVRFFSPKYETRVHTSIACSSKTQGRAQVAVFAT